MAEVNRSHADSVPAVRIVNATRSRLEILRQPARGEVRRLKILSPGEGWLLKDDARSGGWLARLPDGTVIDHLPAPLTGGASWVVVPSGEKATTLIFRNNTAYLATLYWRLNNSANWTLQTSLPAGENLAQFTYAGYQWQARLPDQDDLLLAQVTAGSAARQEVPLRFNSERGGASAGLHITNLIPAPIDLAWMDFDGTEKAWVTLAPYTTVDQTTNAGTRWLVRLSGSRAVLAAFTARAGQQDVAIDSNGLRSLSGGQPAKLTLINTGAAAAALYWIDTDGQEKPQGWLNPGAQVTLDSMQFHAWRVRMLNSGLELACLRLENPGETTIPFTTASCDGKQALNATFTNTSPMTVGLRWFDFEGRRGGFNQLAPGASLSQATFTGHLWLVHAPSTDLVLGGWRMQNGVPDYVFSAEQLQSMKGVRPVSLTVQNILPFPLDLQWQNHDGMGQSKALLKPGAQVALDTYGGHAWTARRPDGQRIAMYVTGAEGRQTWQVSLDKYDGRPAVMAEFTNQTALTTTLHWLDSEREFQYSRLGPQETAYVPTFEGHTWQMRDAASGHKLVTWVISKSMTRPVLTASGVRPAAGGKPCTLTLTNAMPFRTSLYQVISDGTEKLVIDLEPGASRVMQSHAGELWRLREPRSRNEMALAFTPDQPRPAVRFTLLSYSSRQAQKLAFDNQTLLDLQLFWLDYDGKEQKLFDLPPDSAVYMSTYQTHAWLVRDRRTGQVLSAVIASQSKDLLQITPAMLASPGKTAVDVTFENTLPFSVRISRHGGDAHFDMLPPGATLKKTSDSGMVWQAATHNGRVFAHYWLGHNKQETVQVQLIPEKAGSDNRTLKLQNRTARSLSIEMFAADGSLQHHSIQDSFAGETIQAPAGQILLIRDYASKLPLKVQRVTSLKEETVDLEVDLFTSPGVAPEQKLTLVNEFEYAVEVVHTRLGVEITRRTMSAGDALVHEGHTGDVLQVYYPGSSALVDLIVLYPGLGDQYTLQNGLFANGGRLGDVLWPGEVALFSTNDTTGEYRIFSGDIPALQTLTYLGYKVGSLRLGPKTLANLYTGPEYQGQGFAFWNDAVLENPDQPFDSLRTERLVSSEQIHLNVSNRVLTTDSSDGEPKSSYITIFSLPPAVGELEVYASQDCIATSGGQNLALNPATPAKLYPNRAGQVVIEQDVDVLARPPLIVRTNLMGATERAMVFPNAGVVHKLSIMDEGEMWDNRQQLGIRGQYAQDEINNAQKAVQQLAATVRSPSNRSGSDDDRFIEAGRMDFTAWKVEMAGAAPAAAATAMSVAADLPQGRGIPAAPRVAASRPTGMQPISDSEFDSVVEMAQMRAQAAASGMVSFQVMSAGERKLEAIYVKAIPLDRFTGQAVSTMGFFADVWDGIKEGANFIADALEPVVTPVVEAISDGLSLVGDLIDSGLAVIGIPPISGYIKQGLRVLLKIGGEMLDYFVESMDKLAEVMDTVLDKIMEGIGSLVRHLFPGFPWDEVNQTADFLLQTMGDAINQLKGAIPVMRREVRSFMKNLTASIDEAIDSAQDVLGNGRVKAPPPAPDDWGENPLSQAQDKINWVVSKLMQGLEAISADRDLLDVPYNDAQQSEMRAAITRLVQRILDWVEGIPEAFIQAFSNAIWYFQQALNNSSRAVELMVGGVLEMGRVLVQYNLKFFGDFIDLLLGVFEEGLELLWWSLKQPLDIPIFSPFFRGLVERELTTANLMTTIFAIPVTLVLQDHNMDVKNYRRTSSASPASLPAAQVMPAAPADVSFAATAVAADANPNQWKADFAMAVVGGMHIAAIVTTTLADIASGIAPVKSNQGGGSQKKMKLEPSLRLDALNLGVGMITLIFSVPTGYAKFYGADPTCAEMGWWNWSMKVNSLSYNAWNLGWYLWMADGANLLIGMIANAVDESASLNGWNRVYRVLRSFMGLVQLEMAGATLQSEHYRYDQVKDMLLDQAAHRDEIILYGAGQELITQVEGKAKQVDASQMPPAWQARWGSRGLIMVTPEMLMEDTGLLYNHLLASAKPTWNDATRQAHFNRGRLGLLKLVGMSSTSTDTDIANFLPIQSFGDISGNINRTSLYMVDPVPAIMQWGGVPEYNAEAYYIPLAVLALADVAVHSTESALAIEMIRLGQT